MKRAATSVVLNIAEGSTSAKGNKTKHFAIAHGSANEVKAAVKGAPIVAEKAQAAAPLRLVSTR